MGFFRPVLLVFLLAVLFSRGQSKKAGPVIHDFGKVWDIPSPSFPTLTEHTFEVVFDIMESPKDTSQLNRRIETAARFLNMHAQAGVPTDHLKVALVVHNQASKDLLDDLAYKKRYGIDNPNSKMIGQLLDAGVLVVLCGQSSMSRNIPIAETIDGVRLSLSAMTALIQLQNQGYQLIKF